MLPDDRLDIVAYVDAAHTSAGGGVGYVARCGDRILLGAFPMDPSGNSNEAEAKAALAVMAALLEKCPSVGSVDIRTDCQALTDAVPYGSGTVIDYVVAMRELCQAAGARLLRRHCRGHDTPVSASGFLNGSAHALAAMGLRGEARSWEIPFDAYWRMRIMECAPSLVLPGPGLTRDEAAGYVGVPPDVVDALVRNGHVEWVVDRWCLTPSSLIAVRREVLALGRTIPEVGIPLRPMRGRVDEPGSGFGLGVAPSCPVQVTVHAFALVETVAVVACIDGPDGTEIHSRVLPMGGLPAWAVGAEAGIGIAFERHPACDFLTAYMPADAEVDALNGEGRHSDLPFLARIDERIRTDGLTFLARVIPGAWRSAPPSWRVVLPRKMLENGLVGEGPRCWMVEPAPDREALPRLVQSGDAPSACGRDGPCIELAHAG